MTVPTRTPSPSLRHAIRRRGAVLAVAVAAAVAVASSIVGMPALPAAAHVSQRLNHVGSFYVVDNLGPTEPESTPTSAEIVDVTDDGRILAYTDAFTSRLGLVDISDPRHPQALGGVDLPGEPDERGDPGRVGLGRRGHERRLRQPGRSAGGHRPRQPVDGPHDRAGGPARLGRDRPDGRYAAIVIENERDEDVDDGLIPQAPPGLLQILDLQGSYPDGRCGRSP